MTREILFRGKRKDNGEWIEGSLVKSGDRDCFIYPTGCRLHKTAITLYEFIGNPIYEVISDTVGQFTGLIDKNGKKIFEGDKLKAIQQEQNGKNPFKIEDRVRWRTGGLYVFSKALVDCYTKDDGITIKNFMWCQRGHFNIPDIYYEIKDIEVVTDSPELLEDK